MGRACSTYGSSRGAYRVLVGKPEGRNNFEDPGVDERIILKRIFDRDRWRAVVKAVTNLQVP
jgi:uncharacterized protein (UPF0128 family)